MEQFLEIATRFWNDFSSWTPTTIQLYTMLGFGVLSAWIMTRVVAAAPLFAGPISFMILTFAAMISNFSTRSYVMMGTTDLQKAIVFTAIGHAVAGVILLVIFKASAKRSV